MTAVERILKELSKLPEPLVQEVLEFISYLELKHGLKDEGAEDLKLAQGSAMSHVWNNAEDDAWNNV